MCRCRRIGTSYTAPPSVVATFDIRFRKHRTKNSYGIHTKANFEENNILMCPQIIATSHYTINAVLLITISI